MLKRDSHNCILSQTNPIHAIPLHCFHIHSDANLQSTPRSFKWPHSFSFPHQNPICISLLLPVCHRPCPSHPPSFYHLKIYSHMHKSCCSLLRLSPASHYLPLLGPNISFSFLFSNTLSICSSLNVRDQVSKAKQQLCIFKHHAFSRSNMLLISTCTLF